MTRNVPKYRIDCVANVKLDMMVTRDRKMSPEQLEALRRKMNASFLQGGVNHGSLEPTATVPHFSKLTMIEQATRRIVATARAPMFEVY